MILGKKRKEVDVFDEPDFNSEKTSRIPTEEQKQNNRHNVMLSMLKGTMLTYSLNVDSSYELMLCGLPNKETLTPLLDLDKRPGNALNERLVSKVIQNVKELITDEDVPLDYIDPDEIESSYASIKITLAKITSQSEIKDGRDDRIESLAQYTKIANTVEEVSAL